MKEEKIIRNRLKLTECFVKDAECISTRRYQQGWLDCLEWVLRNE